MRVKEICHSITDGSHNPPQGVEESKYLMLSSKNIFDDEITLDDPRFLAEDAFRQEDKRTRIAPGDVLLTIVGTVGRAAVVSDKMPRFTLQRSVAVLHPKEDICSSRYLMYALRSKRTYIEKAAKGVAQKGIYLGEVGEIDLPVPPITQQETIVEVLDKVNAVIQTRQRQLRALDTLIKARFFEMFGDPVANTMGWSTALLQEVTSKIGSGATPRGGKESYQSEGISLIRSMNVHDGHFEYKDLAHITDEQAAQLDNVTVELEDVFINITGASVARSCIVPDDVLPARVNQHVAIIRCKQEYLHPVFANNLFLNDRYKGVLLNIGESGGATRQAITKQQLETLTVIIPPIELQKQFAAFVSQVDKSKLSIQQSLEKLETLKQSLMQQYFG